MSLLNLCHARRKKTKSNYKPYWGMWMDDINFVASLWTSARTDCEVVAGIYEVGLHGKRRGATFAASMSAGRILKSPIVKRVERKGLRLYE